MKELLVPVGSMDSLKAAVMNGADAIYCGTSSLSLRTRAEMNDSDLVKTIEYAHKIGKRVHVAINIFAWDESYEEIKKQVKKYIESGIHEEEFERIKKKIYGEYVMQYNDIDVISRNLLADHFKGIKPFEFIEEFKSLNINYANEILRKMFKEENMVISIVK